MKSNPHLVGEMIVVLISQAMFIYACVAAWRIRYALPAGRLLFGLTVLIALWVGTQRGVVLG